MVSKIVGIITLLLLCIVGVLLMLGDDQFLDRNKELMERNEEEGEVSSSSWIQRKLHRISRRPVRVAIIRRRPGGSSVSRPTTTMYQSTPERNIVETVQLYPELSGVVNLLSTPGLEPLLEELQGDGPFTLFAPSDEAWGKFGRENPELLATMKEDVGKGDVFNLFNLLSYHALNQELRTIGNSWRSGGPFPTKYRLTEIDVSTGDVKSITTTTVETSRYRSGRTGPLVAKVNDDARVVLANIMASNGVIHIIDSVLMTSEESIQTTTP